MKRERMLLVSNKIHTLSQKLSRTYSSLCGGKLELDGMSWHSGINKLSSPELKHPGLLTTCKAPTGANKVAYLLNLIKDI